MGASLGSVLVGLIVGYLGADDIEHMPSHFLILAAIAIGAGALMLVTLPWLKRLMGQVK